MNFKKSLLTYGLADIISKSIGLITSPISTRLLTMSQYGAAPLMSAVWTPFALVQHGGFDWAYSFFLARQQADRERQHLIATASLFAYLSALIVWLFFMLFAFSTGWLPNYASVSNAELALFAAGLLPAALINWLCYLLRFLQRADSYVRITLLGRILPAIFVLPILPWVRQEYRLLVSFGGGWLLSCLALAYALFEIRRVGHWPFDVSLLDMKLAKKMFRYAIFLAPGSFAYALIVITDRLLIGHFLDTEAVAIFAVAMMIGSLGTMFVGWFGLAFDPHLLKWIASGDQDAYLPKLQLLAPCLSVFFATLSSLAAIWSSSFINLIYPAGYVQSAQLVPLVIFAAALTALSRLGVATATISQRAKYHLVIYWFALLANVIIGLVMIPVVGVIGAVISTVFAELIILGCWIYLGTVCLKNLPITWTSSLMILFFALVFNSFVMYSGGEFSLYMLMLLSMLVFFLNLFFLYCSIGEKGMSTLIRYVK